MAKKLKIGFRIALSIQSMLLYDAQYYQHIFFVRRYLGLRDQSDFVISKVFISHHQQAYVVRYQYVTVTEFLCMIYSFYWPENYLPTRAVNPQINGWLVGGGVHHAEGQLSGA